MAVSPSLAQILLIEDNEADIEMARFVFDEARVCNTLCVVRDGAAALDLFQTALADRDEDWPDLVLLDLNLPCVDGAEIIRVLRQTCPKACAVVVLTGGDMESALVSGSLKEADAFLAKPLTVSSLLQTVQALAPLQLGVMTCEEDLLMKESA